MPLPIIIIVYITILGILVLTQAFALLHCLYTSCIILRAKGVRRRLINTCDEKQVPLIEYQEYVNL